MKKIEKCNCKSYYAIANKEYMPILSMAILRGFLAIELELVMRQFNMNQAINYKKYVIYWYKSTNASFIQKYL